MSKGKHRASATRPPMRKAELCLTCREPRDLYGYWCPWFTDEGDPAGLTVCERCGPIVTWFSLHKTIIDLGLKRRNRLTPCGGRR